MCKALYNSNTFLFVQCVFNQVINDTKIQLTDSFSICFFLDNILVLNSRAQDNYPQKVTLMNHDIIQ